MSYIKNNNSNKEFSLWLNNSIKEIKAGQYLGYPIIGIVKPTLILANRPKVGVNYYKITDVQPLPHPIADRPNKRLMVTADYIGDDYSLIPTRAKNWAYSDAIQFAEIKLNKSPVSPLK